MKPYHLFHYVRAAVLLGALLSYHPGAQAKLSTEQLEARMQKVVEAFDAGTTATAMLQADILLGDIGPLDDVSTTLTGEQLTEESYRHNVVAYISSRMFWAAYSEYPDLVKSVSYGPRAVDAAARIYRSGLDIDSVDDYDIANIMITLGGGETEDGDTTSAILWFESAMGHVQCAILNKGPEPELLWQKGFALSSIVQTAPETSDTEQLAAMSREALDLQMQGMITHADDRDYLWGYAAALPDLCWWLFDQGVLDPDDVVLYANGLANHQEPGLAPVIAALNKIRGEWEFEQGDLREALNYYTKAKSVLPNNSDGLEFKIRLIAVTGAVAVELGNRSAARAANEDLQTIMDRKNPSEGQQYLAKSAVLALNSGLKYLDKDARGAKQEIVNIHSLPGFKLDDPDHFWMRASNLTELVYLEDDPRIATKHVRDLKALIDEVAAMDEERVADHNTTEAINLLALAEAKLHGHFWFDEPIAIWYSSGRDSEKIEWSSWDLYWLLEQAYWEADANTMEDVAAELLQRGVSEEYLESTLWLYSR